MSDVTQHSTDGMCSCARHGDGTVTTFLCPAHAEVDPCLTMASVTSRRRKGTIRKGICSNCGHRGRLSLAADTLAGMRELIRETNRKGDRR